MRFVLAALLVLVGSASSALADPLTPFRPASNRVVLADVQPRYNQPENRTNEFYSEWWSFVFRLEGGYTAYVQFLISNMGPGDGKATVKAQFQTPDGAKHSTTTNLDSDQWSWAKDRFELQFGPNILWGPVDGLRLRLQNKKFSAEYVIENIVPPWKPGTAHAQYGTDRNRYYEFQYLAPVARVTGTVKLAGDGGEHHVTGLVHVDHSVSSIGPHEISRSWARFRALDADTTLLVSDIRTPKEYGGAPIRFAVLFNDGKPVFELTDFDVDLSDLYADPETSGYFVPRLMAITATTPKGGKVRGAIKATKLSSREDFLEKNGAATRFIISRFAKPVMYYFDGVFAFQVEEGGKTTEYKGRGTYYYTILNP